MPHVAKKLTQIIKLEKIRNRLKKNLIQNLKYIKILDYDI